MQVNTSAINSRDGVFIGGKYLRYIHNTLKTMTTSTTSFLNESIDQELTIEELGQAQGGFLQILLGIAAAKVIAGTVATGGILIAKGAAGAGSSDVYSPPEQEGDKDDSPDVHY